MSVGKYLNIWILTVLLIGPKLLEGQEQVVEKDFQSWNRISFEYKQSKKISFKLAQSLRLSEKASQVNRVFTQFSTEYKFNKRIRVEAKYRHAYGDNGYHRGIIQVKLRKKLGKISLQLKPRFELNSERSNNTLSTRIRNQGQFSYAFKDLKLSAFVELFNPIESGVNIGKINQFRYGIKSNLELNKKLDVGLSLFIDEEYKRRKDLKDTILRFSLHYTL